MLLCSLYLDNPLLQLLPHTAVFHTLNSCWCFVWVKWQCQYFIHGTGYLNNSQKKRMLAPSSQIWLHWFDYTTEVMIWTYQIGLFYHVNAPALFCKQRMDGQERCGFVAVDTSSEMSIAFLCSIVLFSSLSCGWWLAVLYVLLVVHLLNAASVPCSKRILWLRGMFYWRAWSTPSWSDYTIPSRHQRSFTLSLTMSTEERYSQGSRQEH